MKRTLLMPLLLAVVSCSNGSDQPSRLPGQTPSIASGASTERPADACAIAIESQPAAKGQRIDVDASGCTSGVATLLEHLDKRVAWARKIDSLSLVVPRSADGSGEVESVWEAVCKAHGMKGNEVRLDDFVDAYRNSNLVRVLEQYTDRKRAALRLDSIEPFYVVKAKNRQSNQCDSRLLLPVLWFAPED